MPWGGPWGSPIHGAYPFTQPFTQTPLGVPLSGYPALTASFGGHPQQQQILYSLQVVLQQLQNVPLQLQQLQHIVQLLAQQSHQVQPFFQGPSIGAAGWLAGTQVGQPPMFGGQTGYVM
jgi:hypothetical protein